MRAVTARHDALLDAHHHRSTAGSGCASAARAIASSPSSREPAACGGRGAGHEPGRAGRALARRDAHPGAHGPAHRQPPNCGPATTMAPWSTAAPASGAWAMAARCCSRPPPPPWSRDALPGGRQPALARRAPPQGALRAGGGVPALPSRPARRVPAAALAPGAPAQPAAGADQPDRAGGASRARCWRCWRRRGW